MSEEQLSRYNPAKTLKITRTVMHYDKLFGTHFDIIHHEVMSAPVPEIILQTEILNILLSKWHELPGNSDVDINILKMILGFNFLDYILRNKT
jgi:hypothetical protein